MLKKTKTKTKKTKQKYKTKKTPKNKTKQKEQGVHRMAPATPKKIMEQAHPTKCVLSMERPQPECLEGHILVQI